MTTATFADAVNVAPYRPLSSLESRIRGLSDRLVEAQRPLRILDAVKWGDEVERAFFAAGAREPPPVTRETYAVRPLPFNPESKRRELLDLERDVRRTIGVDHAAGRLLTRMCAEYRTVVDLIACRGTPAFSDLSRRLYGGTADRFHAGAPTLADLGREMAAMLDNLAGEALVSREAPTLDARQTVALLSERLSGYFQDATAVRVRLSDGIAADAAAGCDYIKIRADARFTPREVRLLEVHEGWVHLGTTLNGQRQPVCTFLGKGPPSSTTTQEGLAVLTEVLAFASHPARLRRLTHRIEGTALAESGADFLEVYRFFLSEGYESHEAYQHTSRIFRGSLPCGGPFTKDLSYSRGFVLVYNFIRLAVTRGRVRRVPLLFCGKTNLADLRTLAELADEGLIAPARCVPPPFADLHALSAWMCYANFLGGLSLAGVEEEYAELL
ncbi:MAG TPA: flavohemoglobin expression-modulating QEGLA motif protein [Gemmataceae bacterium]|nr:flavohemoglobin expression-modulating QEGLA motif protein [Gemmataceae bacterium]